MPRSYALNLVPFAFTPYFALTQKDRSRLSYLAHIDVTDSAADELPVGIPVQVELAQAGK